MRGHPRRLGVLSAVLTMLALLIPATPAFAHASVVEVSPADGATSPDAPAEVRVTLDEPVEATSGALRVFDDEARRVDQGLVPDTAGDVVAARLPELDDGAYVISYRVTSEDGHPVAGVTTFTVGAADEVDPALLSDIVEATRATAATVAGRILRGIGYAAGLLAVGAVVFALFVASQREDRRLARRVGIFAAGLAAAVGIAAILVQTAIVFGAPSAAVDAASLGEVVASSFGIATVVRVTAAAALGVLWAAALPSVALVAGVGVIGSYLLEGHQRTVDPSWLLVGADAVHLGAAAVWFAGVILVAAVVRRRDRESPARAVAVVSRFSSVAIYATAAVAIAGVVMAIPLVGSPSALVSTTYGRLLLVKLAVALAVIAGAAVNRWVLLPGLAQTRKTPEAVAVGAVSSRAGDSGPHPDDATATAGWRRLATTLRIEVVGLAIVLLVTGFLAVTQPASEAAGLRGLYETTGQLGAGLEVDVVVDPNRVGRNTMHVYVLDETGRPASDVEELTMELTFREEQIGPITVEPLSAGPGHWVATIDDFVFPGDWDVRFVAGIDRFTEGSTTVTIPVAP